MNDPRGSVDALGFRPRSLPKERSILTQTCCTKFHLLHLAFSCSRADAHESPPHPIFHNCVLCTPFVLLTKSLSLRSNRCYAPLPSPMFIVQVVSSACPFPHRRPWSWWLSNCSGGSETAFGDGDRVCDLPPFSGLGGCHVTPMLRTGPYAILPHGVLDTQPLLWCVCCALCALPTLELHCCWGGGNFSQYVASTQPQDHSAQHDTTARALARTTRTPLAEVHRWFLLVLLEGMVWHPSLDVTCPHGMNHRTIDDSAACAPTPRVILGVHAPL